MFGLGFGELVLILLIALIFIGPKKLPELAKGLGKGLRDFQNAAKGFSDQMQNMDETTKEDEKTTAQLSDSAGQQTTDLPEEAASSKKETHS